MFSGPLRAYSPALFLRSKPDKGNYSRRKTGSFRTIASAGFALFASFASADLIQFSSVLGGTSSGIDQGFPSGQLVGWVAGTQGAGSKHAFVYQNGKTFRLTLGGTSSQVVASGKGGTLLGKASTADGRVRMFLFRDGRIQALPYSPDRFDGILFVNDRGDVVVEPELWYDFDGQVRITGNPHVFSGGVLQKLSFGGKSGYAEGLTESGDVIGWSSTASGEQRAFRWRNGQMTDLGAGYEYSAAVEANSKGDILLLAKRPETPNTRLYLLQGNTTHDLTELTGIGHEVLAKYLPHEYTDIDGYREDPAFLNDEVIAFRAYPFPEPDATGWFYDSQYVYRNGRVQYVGLGHCPSLWLGL